MSLPMFNYSEFTSRNSGFVSREAQENIAKTRFLIAGCGVGSSIAEAAVRLGFTKFILVDGDAVETTDLNRQAYGYKDVGQLKVRALANRMRAINPSLDIIEVPEYFNSNNISAWVGKADLVCDTIDVGDLKAILKLHDCCAEMKKPLVTAVGVGWAAAAIYIPENQAEENGGGCLIRELFQIPKGAEEGANLAEAYKNFFSVFAQQVDPAVVSVLAQSFSLNPDLTLGVAPRVISGNYAVASLVMTLLNEVFSGRKLRPSRYLLLTDNLKTVVGSEILLKG